MFFSLTPTLAKHNGLPSCNLPEGSSVLTKSSKACMKQVPQKNLATKLKKLHRRSKTPTLSYRWMEQLGNPTSRVKPCTSALSGPKMNLSVNPCSTGSSDPWDSLSAHGTQFPQSLFQTQISQALTSSGMNTGPGKYNSALESTPVPPRPGSDQHHGRTQLFRKTQLFALGPWTLSEVQEEEQAASLHPAWEEWLCSWALAAWGCQGSAGPRGRK